MDANPNPIKLNPPEALVCENCKWYGCVDLGVMTCRNPIMDYDRVYEVINTNKKHPLCDANIVFENKLPQRE